MCLEEKDWSRIDLLQEWENRGGSCSGIPPQPSLYRMVVTCILWLVAIRIESDDNTRNPFSVTLADPYWKYMSPRQWEHDCQRIAVYKLKP